MKISPQGKFCKAPYDEEAQEYLGEFNIHAHEISTCGVDQWALLYNARSVTTQTVPGLPYILDLYEEAR